MGTGHAQHAAVFVFGPLAAGIRVQHLEVDAIPVPAQAALATAGPGDRTSRRRQQWQPRQLKTQARQVAGMIEIVVAEQHPLGRRLAQGPQ